MTARKRTKLTNLRMRRVDLVDAGDNPGAEILLAKARDRKVSKNGPLTLGEVVSQNEVGEALNELYNALCAAVWNNLYGDGTPQEKAANIKTSIAQFAATLTAEVDGEFAGDAALIVDAGDQVTVAEISVEYVQKMADAALGRALRVVRKVTGQSLHEPAIDPALKEKKMADDSKDAKDKEAKDKADAEAKAKAKAMEKRAGEADALAAETVTLKARVVELEKQLAEAKDTPEVIEKRKLEALPADIRKQMEEDRAEVKKLREDAELTAFTKRAADLDIAGTTAEKFAPVLKRIHKGGTTAEDATEIERLFKSLSAVARQSSVFKALGVAGQEQQEGSALAEVQKRVAKLQSDEKLSYAEASARVTQDRELMDRVSAEKAN